MVEVSGQTSEYVNFINIYHDLKHGDQHSHKGRDFKKSFQCFPLWKFGFIHGNQHSQHQKKYKKTKTPKQEARQHKIQGSDIDRSSKDTKID